MNFAQLEYVIAVHQHKNFSQAAYACDITQATLSAMVKKLEEELGYVLFDRSRQPVQTTEEGIVFIDKASKILSLKSELFEVDDEEISELTGKLRLGIIPTVANSLVGLILPDLLGFNPKLELELKEVTTAEIKQQLLQNDLDLAIAATPFEETVFDEEVVYYEPMLVYGVDASAKQYISTSEITENRIWLLEEGHCFSNQVATVCEIKKKQKDMDAFSFQANSFETLIQLVEQMGGYTLLPELYYNNLSSDKKAKTKYFQKPIPVREISIVSYRMNTRKKTVNYLKKLILSKVTPQLSTGKYKNNELDIIGI